MSDRFEVSIRIGGILADVDIDDLAKAIVEDNAGNEWGSPFLTPEEAVETIREILDSGESLLITDPETKNPTLDTIESCCQEIGLTYYRYDGGNDDYDGSGSFWSPDLERPKFFPVNKDAEPTISLSTLKRQAKAGTALQDLIEMLDFPTVPPLTQATGHRNMERAAAKAKRTGEAT